MAIKLDQRAPGTWLAIGFIIFILGGAVRMLEGRDDGAGLVLAVVGGITMVIGLLIFVVRAGTSVKD